MINALSIDLEPWHAAEIVARRYRPPDQVEDQVVESVTPLLKLLKKYRQRATFFVLGTVAENHPVLILEISQEGHEIACHGYSHRRLHELGRAAFQAEIRRCVRLLTEITGKPPAGFRAPTFSLDNSTRWALEVLRENGFLYDSSIFPAKTGLYGVPGAPVHPYRPSAEDVAVEDSRGEIVEFPLTVINLGKNIPVAGGFYLRALPFRLTRQAFRLINRHRPVVVFIHPWETYTHTPKVPGLNFFDRFVTYYGIGPALGKFEALLREFRFEPLEEVLFNGKCSGISRGCSYRSCLQRRKEYRRLPGQHQKPDLPAGTRGSYRG